MCGRYTVKTPASEIAEIFDLAAIPSLFPRYNIAPTQPVACVRQVAGGSGPPLRELALLRWGLIPRWAKDLQIGSSLINARADGVAVRPAFRDAFQHRRCLVVADGFFEWRKLDSKTRQPYYISLIGGRAFAFAGLWESWQGPEGPLESCTIITTDANTLIAPIHNRMPVILPGNAYQAWLDPTLQDPGTLQPLLQPFPAEQMQTVPVSPLVNNTRNESPQCIAPVPGGRSSSQPTLF